MEFVVGFGEQNSDCNIPLFTIKWSQTGVQHLRPKALMQIFSAISEKSVFLPQIHSVSVLPRVYGKTADNFWDTFSKVYRTFTVSFIVLSVIALFRLTFWWAFFRRGSVIIWRHTTYLNLAWHLQALRNIWGRLGFIPTIF